jgi:hypothetical protein
VTARLERVEQIIDASGTARRIEALLPVGVRPRQLSVRTLLAGIVLAMLAGRAALLVGVHKTLTELATEQQRRLGILAQWKTGPHLLTYRQLEYTLGRIVKALAKQTPDGAPSQILSNVLGVKTSESG